MTTTKHKAFTAAIASALTTELNTLANNANSALSAAIDNTSALDLYCDLTLTLGTQSTRSAGAIVAVFIVPALDGTNYDATNEVTAETWATFTLDPATTARQLTVRDCPIGPGLYKIFARNRTGQAFAASGNIVEVRFHSLESA